MSLLLCHKYVVKYECISVDINNVICQSQVISEESTKSVFKK